MLKIKTADQLYNYCLDNRLGIFQNSLYNMLCKWWKIKHFRIIVNNLKPDENIYCVFTGLHSYTNVFEHRNSYAYAITNKRIIMAQQRILGQAIQSIDINNINDITLVKGGCLFLGRGKICVSSYKETFNVGVNLMFASNIHDSIHKALDEVLKNNQKDNLSNQGEVTEQIKKYKELLDMGAISLEEFNAKKDQLLHL